MRRHETEVKIRISNPKSFRKKLLQIGLVEIHKRALEDNLLFDTPERTLRQQRAILRLRRYGSEWWLTYKGTPVDDPLYKSRIELQSEISDAESLREIFLALGLTPVFRYQKFRQQFAPAGTSRHSVEVALDETPVGNFIELEGSRAAIDRTARQLGFSRKDYSTASYGRLYLEDCQSRNVPPGDMVFPRKRRQSTARAARARVARERGSQ